jgi:hypothetical protein
VKFIHILIHKLIVMNGEETTTIGQVAESQQNISNPNETAPVAEQPAQSVQPEQTAVADNN